MDEVKVLYGSTTGNTESAARQIADAFGTKPVNIADATPADLDAALLILGSSTWGVGELQGDWTAAISRLANTNLTGRKVAVFGLGDQEGFGDSFCDAMGELAQTALSRGAILIGRTSAEGYRHIASTAEEDGSFCGLALDHDNEPERTPDRIAAWVTQLKQEMNQP